AVKVGQDHIRLEGLRGIRVGPIEAADPVHPARHLKPRGYLGIGTVRFHNANEPSCRTRASIPSTAALGAIGTREMARRWSPSFGICARKPPSPNVVAMAT